MIRKKYPDSIKLEDGHYHDQDYSQDSEKQAEDYTLSCDCGSISFLVNWLNYPYSGGYCKVKCTKCNCELVLIDDFA